MKTMFFCTTGSSDPTRASIPLHLAANGSVEVGHDVAVLLAGDGAELLDQATVERIEGVGVPPMRELVAKLLDHGVPVYVWKGCAVARGATDDDLARLRGTWMTPPEAATLLTEYERVLTF